MTSQTLTLAEKALLTGGADLWHTVAIDRAGFPALRLTDGPNGARGERWSSGTSACLPCATALAATWNRDLVHQVGRVLGDEARLKGAQVLLAPTVNIHRHPITGRHFESFSEDPYLSAELAVAYIRGVQQQGISAVVKHFVCNDQEYERNSISVVVDERALREIYLPPFEAAVKKAGVWAVMSAYNRLDGTYCSEHTALLTGLLRTEWGFDGLVVSDWRGTHSSGAITAGLDLEMPGPPYFLGHHLELAVKNGDIPEAALDRAVGALGTWIARTASTANGAQPAGNARDVARAAAAEAIVLLRNDGLLPLNAQRLERVALIGPLAARPAAQGGGSAEVSPHYVVTPYEALQERLGNDVQIIQEPGCALPGLLPVLDEHLLRDLRADYFVGPEVSGQPQASEHYQISRTFWLDSPAPEIPPGQFSARVRGTFVPDRDGPWQFGLASAGQARLLVDGQVLLDNFAPVAGDTFFGQGSPQITGELSLRAGASYDVEVVYRSSPNPHMSGLRIGAEPVMAADARSQAVEAARGADVAIVVVGYDSRWESEGFDRPNMDLPGDQDALIREVLAANPRTVVVVNTGAPVKMDWAEDVPALLQLWFPGQECGAALAQVLFGDVDASGRLPTTFARRLEDTPAFASYPGSEGQVHYAEGVFVGYRHYDRTSVEPRFCFGHGLSYTSFAYANLNVAGATVSVDVTNTGQRPGSEVVQVYVHDLSASVERPEQELAQFAKVHLAPGETRRVELALDERAFSFWDVDRHDWRAEPGEFEIRVGSSSRAIRVRKS